MNPMQAQGISALLNGMPQGPSRASIGSMQDRVEAYRPNPAALQQKTNVSQDLLDLLALQKLKSEKEAAMRSLQLQMPQGQQPTVAQQREQEVQELTKQEIAPQVAGASTQQAQQKQAVMQKLMAGVANAPGAGQVMPARMATGGIVAFQNRGEVPDPKKSQEEEDRKAILKALSDVGMGASKLAAAGYDVFTMPVRALAGIYNTLARAPRAFGAEVPFIPKGFGSESMTPMMDVIRAKEQAPKEEDLVAKYAQDMPSELPIPGGYQRPPARPAPTRRPPLPNAAEPGVASLAGAGMRMPGQAPAAPQMAPELGKMDTSPIMPAQPAEGGLQALLRATGIDPEAIRRQRMEEAKGIYGATPEEEAFRKQEIERIRSQMQPKAKPWYEGLSELVANMQPSATTAGTLGQVSRAASGIRETQRQRQEQQQAALSKLQQDLLSGQRAGREKAFEAGTAAETAAATRQAQRGELGVGLGNIDARLGATAAQVSEGAAERASREKIAFAQLASEEKRRGSDMALRARELGMRALETQINVAQSRVQGAISQAEKSMKDRFGANLTLYTTDRKSVSPEVARDIETYQKQLYDQLVDPALKNRDRLYNQVEGAPGGKWGELTVTPSPKK